VVVTTIAGRYPSWPFRVGKRSIPTMSFVLAGGTGAVFTAASGAFYQNANNSVDSGFGWWAADDL
jgi:hypothetical protein